jgi:hypothetical protein
VTRAVVVFVVASTIAIAACFVSSPTDALQCHATMDCASGRVCLENFCVVQGGGNCPTECTSCDFLASTPTCDYNGAGGDFTCPQGFACVVDCESAGACGNITCGSGSCMVTCRGQGACGNITCNDSCACDVTCNQGACGNETCPVSGGTSCVTGSNCDSSVGTCNTCP